jgi:hypothetical protein
MNQCQYSFLNSSHHTVENLNSTIEKLQHTINKLSKENCELKKINRNLNSKLSLLINDNDIVKNVKLDIQEQEQDNSDSAFGHTHSEETLKEFFYLLVICEKMKYMNLDHIWMIDSGLLYREVLGLDLAFYEWGAYLAKRLEKEFGSVYNSVVSKKSDCGVISKLK